MSKTSVVIAYLEQMRQRAKIHIDELKFKQTATGRTLVKPFDDISNKINVALGITNLFQKNSQFKTNSGATPEEVLVQALKTVYRDFLFVASMSTIEYHFAQILLQYPNYQTAQKIQKKGVRNVKFGKLISWAGQERILTDYDLWDFAISARNDIVHHNAIARHEKACPIKDFPIDMVQGQELSGNLRSLLSMTRHVEESFYSIILNL